MDYKVYLGTISCATMKPKDLIPVFIEELKRIDHNNEYTDVIKEGEQIIQSEDWDSENTSMYLNEDLWNALDNFSPPYAYFGAHPGDGADFGYWLPEFIEDDFDGLKVSDTSEIPDDYTGEVLHVNDHGNMTLYNVTKGQTEEIWAIV
jgi:hypothetical protein